VTANRITAIAWVAVLLSAPLGAQLPVESTAVTAALTAPLSQWDAQAGDVGADLGTGWNILQIPAAAFTPAKGDMTYVTNALGYVLVDTFNSDYFFAAPVMLPTGAGIGYFDLYAFDNDPLGDVLAELYLLRGFGCRMILGLCQLPVPPTKSLLVSVKSIGAPGYQYIYSAELNPLHTVNNNVLQNGAQYVVWVSSVCVGCPARTFSFRGVDIWWKRQISPAPGTARFTDVPVTAQFFREVEALAESGITLGCTATTFCPEAPLTRRQMAAFLARALGLYWQY
jgi:hypothetical protein